MVRAAFYSKWRWLIRLRAGVRGGWGVGNLTHHRQGWGLGFGFGFGLWIVRVRVREGGDYSVRRVDPELD